MPALRGQVQRRAVVLGPGVDVDLRLRDKLGHDVGVVSRRGHHQHGPAVVVVAIVDVGVLREQGPHRHEIAGQRGVVERVRAIGLLLVYRATLPERALAGQQFRRNLDCQERGPGGDF